MSKATNSGHLAHKFATSGNDYASKEKYTEATSCFTKAIELNPEDHRFYSNRAFCYAQLGRYDKSLEDSIRATSLKPDNARAWFRRGVALKGLMRYRDAEAALLNVMRLNEDCEVAQTEIKACRESEMAWEKLKTRGITAREWQEALFQAVYPSVAYERMEQLIAQRETETLQTVNGKMETLTLKHKPLELISFAPTPAVSQNGFHCAPGSPPDKRNIRGIDYADQKLVASKPSTGDPLIDPANPLKCATLWVGNLNSSIKKQLLRREFERFGRLRGDVALQLDKKCAFVNFDDNNYKAAGEAMRHLQGKELCGAYLYVKFPDRALQGPHSGGAFLTKATIEATKLSSAVNGVLPNGECYYWRTTGCTYGDKCRHIHVPNSKGLDRMPWMKSSEQKTVRHNS